MNGILNVKHLIKVLKQKCTNKHRASITKIFHVSTCLVCPSKYRYVKTTLNCRS